jgi:ABC-type transporter Mla maintaining outer membrane lipid asymmetry ATPase subunit MlaF
VPADPVSIGGIRINQTGHVAIIRGRRENPGLEDEVIFSVTSGTGLGFIGFSGSGSCFLTKDVFNQRNCSHGPGGRRP